MPQLELLAYADSTCLNILVPKRRGTGYVMVPVGHHPGPIDLISDRIRADVSGLDGNIVVECGPMLDRPERLAEIMQEFATHYGMSWREVDRRTFFRLHPLGG